MKCNLIAMIFIRRKRKIKRQKISLKEKVVLLLCVFNLCQIAGYSIELQAAVRGVITVASCQIQAFIICFCTYSNIGLFVSLTIERYISISYPFSCRGWYKRKTISALFLLLPACIGLVLGAPPLIGWGRYERPRNTSTYCTYRFKNFSDRSFYIIAVLGGFIIPTAIASICFSKIIKELRRAASNFRLRYGRRSVITRQSCKRAKGEEVYSVVIGIIYAISWLPYAVVCFLCFCNQYVPLGLEYFAICMCKSSTVSSAILFCLIERPFCKYVKRKESVNVFALRRSPVSQRSQRSFTSQSSYSCPSPELPLCRNGRKAPIIGDRGLLRLNDL